MRGEVGAVERQRAIERGPLAGGVAGQAVGVGEVAPQRSGPRVRLGRCLERAYRGRAVATAQRRKSLGVGAARGIGVGGGGGNRIAGAPSGS